MITSFDTKKGKLKVDYRKYMAKHDIVYNSPNTKHEHAVLVGTGKIGACVWEEEGIKLQVTHVDASPQTQISSGWVHIQPHISGEQISQRLDLYDGTLKINYNEQMAFEMVGGSGEEYIGIKVTDYREKPMPIDVSLTLWKDFFQGVEGNRYAVYFKNRAQWEQVEYNVEENIPILSRGSSTDETVQGAEGEVDRSDETIFGYSLGVWVDQANYAVQVKEEGGYTLCIEPESNNYYIWIINPARLNCLHKSKDNSCTIAQVKSIVRMLKQTSFQDYQQKSHIFWHDFWEKSFVMYHNTQSDYLENIYYVSQYLFACGMHGTMPYHFINGVTRNQEDSAIRWSVAYWWYNQRDLYNGLWASGHFESIEPHLNLYLNTMTRNRADTKKAYPHAKGMMVPETMGWDGNRFFTDSPYVEWIFATGAEVALALYNHYLYTQKEEVASEQFYPYAKEVAGFYLTHVLEQNEKGQYGIPLGRSNAREAFWQVKDSIVDLGAIRALFPLIIETGKKLNRDEDFNNQLQNVLENLTPLPIGKQPLRYVYGDLKFPVERTNADDPAMEILYPYNLSGIGAPDYSLMLNSYEYRVGRHQRGGGISWDNAAIWAARLGLGNEVYKNIKFYVASTQIYQGGHGSDGNCRYEFNGNLINAIHEASMQSYNGKIRVFPAPVLDQKAFEMKFSLYAQNGFIISSEFDQASFSASYVGIKSLAGNPCTLINPWGQETEIVVIECSAHKSMSYKGQAEITFETQKEAVYLIVPKEKWDFELETVTIAGEPNQSKKTLKLDEYYVQLGN